MTATVKWYRQPADQGDATAQYWLGTRYAIGDGVAKDEVEAVKWYRKAADQGSGEAHYHLGMCYAEGRGVAPDEVEAYAYLKLANVRQKLANLENALSPEVRIRGQQRAMELQAEIKAKIAANKAGK